MVFRRALVLPIVSVSVLACVAFAAAFLIYAWAPALPAVARPAPDSFAPALVRQGAQLAALGNCISCHTAEGRPSFSGGRPLETPFGTIFSTNLTPDRETGLGAWSEEAFQRTLRQGLDREGRHLYPAFPYDHFTRVSDEDDRALYAFFMTREPVHATPLANRLVFPLNIRLLVAGWKALYFHPGAQMPEPTRDPAWNRGRYLVEGLGHCGACHTPRNALGAEIASAPLAGGKVEGWSAYALNEASAAPVPWTVDAMAAYLGQGWAAHHGVSRGPMAEVTLNLADVPTEDLAAMGTYLVSSMGVPSPERVARAHAFDEAEPPAVAAAAPSAGRQVALPAPVAGTAPRSGATIFATACASCHDGNQPLPGGGLPLDLSTATHAPDPSNLVAVTLRGLVPVHEGAGGLMPGFAGVLDDRDVAALLAYIRESVAKEPPWTGLADTVRDVAARNRGPGARTAVPVGTNAGEGS